ncbi:MAG: GatB/YqeY domain-containing protein [Spirochaetia bacterium]|nr:GatB/YqeY domain-containing protein [Spirochaetia bacterium]
MEYTIKAFTMERLKIRKEDPVRSNVLLMLADAVKRVAVIDERRPETEADFKKAALKMYQETQNTIAEYKKGNADTSELEKELKVLEEFLPKMLSAEQMEAEARKVIEAMPEADRVLKNIMPKLKEIEGFDMKQAKAIIEKVLA